MALTYPQPGTFGARLKESLEDNAAPTTQQGARAWFRRHGVEISTTMIFNYYRDELPRIEQCRKYAGALGVCVEWLYTGEGPKHPLTSMEISLVDAFREIVSESERGRALGLVQGMASGGGAKERAPPTKARERQISSNSARSK